MKSDMKYVKYEYNTLFQELRRRLATLTKDAYYYISKTEDLKEVGTQLCIL